MIATYALCGFANLGSIGVMLGALGAMAPHRKSDLAKGSGTRNDCWETLRAL